MSHPGQSDNESLSGIFPSSWELSSELPLLTADDTLPLQWLDVENMPGYGLSPVISTAVIKQEEVEPHSTTVVESNTNCANHCAEDWPGNVGFQVVIEDCVPANNVWTYSEERRKLYIMMNKALPVYFVTDKPPPPGTTVCIVAVFRDPNLRLKSVSRCPIHAAESPVNPDDCSRNHWILCDHPSTVYAEDEANGHRKFLTVPFEAPDCDSNGQFTYRLRFMCRNSCIGTMDRQATDVLFILQSREGCDLARRIIEVKVCACPHRDRKHDEMSRKSAAFVQSAHKVSSTKIADRMAHVGSGDVGQHNTKHEKRKIYTIDVYDKEKYEFLHKVQIAWEAAEAAMAIKKKKRNTAPRDDQRK